MRTPRAVNAVGGVDGRLRATPDRPTAGPHSALLGGSQLSLSGGGALPSLALAGARSSRIELTDTASTLPRVSSHLGGVGLSWRLLVAGGGQPIAQRLGGSGKRSAPVVTASEASASLGSSQFVCTGCGLQSGDDLSRAVRRVAVTFSPMSADLSTVVLRPSAAE